MQAGLHFLPEVNKVSISKFFSLGIPFVGECISTVTIKVSRALAIAIRLDAMASRFDVMTLRLEATAIRLEAIASR